MRILSLSRGYASFGGGACNDAGLYFTSFLEGLAPEDFEIETTAFHRPARGPRRTLEGLYDQFVSNFPTAATAKFLRKTGKITITYPSGIDDGVAFSFALEDIAQVFPTLVRELAEAILESVAAKKAALNVLELSALTTRFENAISHLPSNTAKIPELVMKLRDSEKQRKLSIPVTMGTIEVNWSRFHREARSLLNHPFFWNEADDDAPHGNDTGADLLNIYRRWRKKNPDISADGFVERLMSQWGLNDSEAVEKLGHDHLAVVRAQAEIGLAFAELKIVGICTGSVSKVARAAIDHKLERLDDPQRSANVARLKEALARWGGQHE